jgi:hypothetical protein
MAHFQVGRRVGAITEVQFMSHLLLARQNDSCRIMSNRSAVQMSGNAPTDHMEDGPTVSTN